MLTNLSTFIQDNPFKALGLALLIGVVGTKIVQENPLEEKPLLKYRVVYEHTAEYGRECGDTGPGYYWFAQELHEGFLSEKWEPMGWCADTERKAIANAEDVIKKRVETMNSKNKVYQAWATKEDSVRFEPLKVEE
ncbi:hypothetical protein VPHD485_0300 [Vibrio phage D485]